jgi:predicted NUDIX family phosphoesterase
VSEDELVLVVPRHRIVGDGGWHGLLGPDVADCLAAIAEAGRFEPRAAMEEDSRFKQVIPYLVLRDRGSYFLMRRTRAGADARLHDRFSIGIGGHLNPGDRDLAGGLRREWSEELEAGFVPELRLLGLLNDDSTDVGRVHLGVVYVAEAGGHAVAVRETAKLEGQFAPESAVAGVYERLETWSQLVFDVLSGRTAMVPGPAPCLPRADGPLA